MSTRSLDRNQRSSYSACVSYLLMLGIICLTLSCAHTQDAILSPPEDLPLQLTDEGEADASSSPQDMMVSATADMAGESAGENAGDISGGLIGGVTPTDMGDNLLAGQDLDMHIADSEPPSDLSEIPERRLPGVPTIHDLSGADPQHVDQLVIRALEGLGLDEVTGPDERDRVFVGRWYIAWIDETGFYGKINGLWPLNGDLDALDFVLLDGSRPVNAFIVGEHGRGVWPEGYMGSEHIEFPNATPAEGDDPACAETFCAQYSHGEAPHYTSPRIPTWSACNSASPNWNTHFTPISIERTAEGVQLWYEGPLTQQGDFGGRADGQGCGEDFLFADGVRRRVYLRVGYLLHAQAHMVDRTLQVHNPEGNPPFDGPMSFIGGFVMTQWPSPHRLKALNRYARMHERDTQIRWGDDTLRLARDAWSSLPLSVPRHDVVLGWADQQVTLSPHPAFTLGRAYSVFNPYPSDRGDNGFCLCVVHGAIELGGGLIQDPVSPGTLSSIATRRLLIHYEDPPPQTRTWIYEAEGGALQHNIGRLDQEGWSADPLSDEAGYLIYGPYARDLGEGPRSARFRMLVDAVDRSAESIVTLDIYDADAREILASRVILHSEFIAAFRYQDFVLNFNLNGRPGHAIETRIYWHDRNHVKVDHIIVSD